jgi:ATP-dependent RNA helicase RhlB
LTKKASPAEAPENEETPFRQAPVFLTDTRFDQFDLPQPVLQGIADTGFVYCSPIQARVLPISLTGRDVAGQAQTGTGKTAAFLVTVLTRLLSLPPNETKSPSVIIVAPTRELAAQIHEEALILARHTNFKMAQIVGGIDYQKQADTLRTGVDIVICTPGRIIDYYKQKVFKTDQIKLAVIDEADRLLDLGFAKDMRFILAKLPPYTERQSMLFSATLSYRVMELTYEYMNLPEYIAVAPEAVTVKGIDQKLIHVGVDEKLPLLLGLLKREEWDRMLIFVNTKSGVEWLSAKLKGNGWPAEGITGDMRQRMRFRLMDRFKNGKLKILVATDVASRGLHVDDISHVINYDLPQDAENYIHRIGRTARAGKTGRAFSLACDKYVYHLGAIEEMLGDKIPVVWPEDDWFEKDRCGPVKTARALQKSRTARRKKHSGGKPSAPRRQPRRRPVFKTRSTHPGAFFGFAPPANDSRQAEGEQKPPAPKPSRRRRRKPRAKPKKPPASNA